MVLLYIHVVLAWFELYVCVRLFVNGKQPVTPYSCVVYTSVNQENVFWSTFVCSLSSVVRTELFGNCSVFSLIWGEYINANDVIASCLCHK